MDIQTREQLLQQLGHAFNRGKVPAAFWACLKVSDIDALKTLVKEATAAPRLFRLLFDTSLLLPRLWMQGKLKDRELGAEVERSLPSETWNDLYSEDESCSEDKLESENTVEMRKANRRDSGCVVLRVPFFRICHIVPPLLLNEERAGYLRPAIPDYWELLNIFYGDTLVREWKTILSRDSERCNNFLCLNLNLYVL